MLLQIKYRKRFPSSLVNFISSLVGNLVKEVFIKQESSHQLFCIIKMAIFDLLFPTCSSLCIMYGLHLKLGDSTVFLSENHHILNRNNYWTNLKWRFVRTTYFLSVCFDRHFLHLRKGEIFSDRFSRELGVSIQGQLAYVILKMVLTYFFLG